MEQHARGLVPGEDAVEESDVKMDVQIHARPASLNKIDRAALSILDPVAPGASAVAREDGLDRDAPDCREHVSLEGGQLAQLVGQG